MKHLLVTTIISLVGSYGFVRTSNPHNIALWWAIGWASSALLIHILIREMIIQDAKEKVDATLKRPEAPK